MSFFKPVLVSKLFNFDRKCFVMHKFVNHDLESTEADKMIVACTLHVHGSGEEGWRRKILQLQLQPLAVTKGSRMVVKNFEQFWQLGFFFIMYVFMFHFFADHYTRTVSIETDHISFV